MLKSLRVRDLALISAAEVQFGPGLNLLTGETGSGKSLVVDALTLSLGARASTDQVRHGADRALVESVFDLSAVPAVSALLVEMGFEAELELVLSREIGGRGGSRVNGRPATPGQLRQLGRLLVDVHGQHEHQSLLDPDAQTSLLDGLAGAAADLESVVAAHAAWRTAEEEVRELERRRDRGAREREFGEWQLAELRRVAPRAGEDQELAAEREVSRHAVRLTELTQGAREALESGEDTLRAVAQVRSAAELDQRLLPLAERLETAAEELRDVANELRRYGETFDADPARLESLESRLAELETVKKRFGGSLEAAIAERDRLERELSGGEDLETALASAERRVGDRRAALDTAAEALSRRRAEAAERMGRGVAVELAGLHLEGARFQVDLEPRPEVTASGAEQALMRFSANPGEPLAPLSRVASGGELARVMLAIKTVGAAADSLPTLVFDEVDAGIGGEAALQVGLRLAALGASRQVLVVTHLAQIAAYGDRHLLVEKSRGAQGRNLVAVRELAAGDGRAAELARMMSGSVTDKALARAHELLEEAAGR
ncbi:MAG TPA: DNA repair protein RecN [Candidatus Dormibacteraeota bacterium]|nr:DNA repair protein RecN [Candidatus Dormibacteraeota bacterium]